MPVRWRGGLKDHSHPGAFSGYGLRLVCGAEARQSFFMRPVSVCTVWRLLGATAAWGMSFPTAKALMLLQAELVAGKPAWFHAAFVLWNRMLLATVFMVVWSRRRLLRLERAEIRQGLELGLSGGVGMLLQTDAQNYVSASTSAFFTQFTCVFVPVLVAWRMRAFPSGRVLLATALVMAGCAFLNGPQSGDWLFGRGEWETIAAAAFFTAQILSLERERYRANEMRSVAAVMFATKAALCFPVVCAGAVLHVSDGGTPNGSLWNTFSGLYASGPLWMVTGILTLFSTVYGYVTMTRWQPLVSSVQAGLIYATEPVFATVWALFLPGFFSWLGAIDYPNEQVGAGFLRGAAMVLAANLLLLLRRHE
jgi:drug/metabolite transporter (DMT)-like permease